MLFQATRRGPRHPGHHVATEATASFQVAWLCVGLLAVSAAQTHAESHQETHSKRLAASHNLQALGADLFGDKVDLYTGTTTFAVTDVALTGSSGLPVAIARKYTVGAQEFPDSFFDNDTLPARFGEWELDLPHLEGTYAWRHGWQAGGGAARCSGPQLDSMTPWNADDFRGSEYWSGNRLSLPGGNSRLLLLATTPASERPQQNLGYRWVTTDHWYLSCVMLKNGKGEGFLAHAPDGTRYYFDWMALRSTAPLSADSGKQVARVRVLMLPTRIEDGYGNWVVYRWNNGQLLSIEANDGRKLSMTYSARSPDIRTVSDGDRTWRYDYNKGPLLRTVTLPDGSYWYYDIRRAYFNIQPNVRCGRSIVSETTSKAWMDHPSGAKAEFEFRSQEHGRSQVQEPCSRYARADVSNLYFTSMAVRRKKIWGPGLPERSWTTLFSKPQGSDANCPQCASTKTVEVYAGNDRYERYLYGTRDGVNEGMLLQMEEGSDPNHILRTTALEYDTPISNPSPAFTRSMGYAGTYFGRSAMQEWQLPLRKREIHQDGQPFVWSVDAFDGRARPARIIETGTTTARQAP